MPSTSNAGAAGAAGDVSTAALAAQAEKNFRDQVALSLVANQAEADDTKAKILGQMGNSAADVSPK